jgi:RimJ/RimL family protein N-acetyltransferase
MAFGPIMKLSAGELQIELAPIQKDDLVAFVSPGIQQASVSRYLSHHVAPTLEDEQEWYEKTRADKTSLIWGIWVVENDERKLIGTTGLHEIKKGHILEAVSGSMIVDTAYWRRGIASAIHKARTWYAFKEMGLTCIKSDVIQGNVASRRALEKSGYYVTHVERNTAYVSGELRHLDQLLCVNPAEWAWRTWWGTDRPTKASREARSRAQEAMNWATENNVALP